MCGICNGLERAFLGLGRSKASTIVTDTYKMTEGYGDRMVAVNAVDAGCIEYQDDELVCPACGRLVGWLVILPSNPIPLCDVCCKKHPPAGGCEGGSSDAGERLTRERLAEATMGREQAGRLRRVLGVLVPELPMQGKRLQAVRE